MREDLCICCQIPSWDVSTRVVVLMHHRELKTTTNTGRIAALALKNSEIRVRGRPHQTLKTNDLILPDRDTLLLYPSDDAETLTPEFAAGLRRPLTLIVPDGNWRQASKVGYREPGLKEAKRIKLAVGALSEYKLRREPKPEGLATIEAIARALGVLESPALQNSLESIFKLMVDRTLWSRGLLPTAECLSSLPNIGSR